MAEVFLDNLCHSDLGFLQKLNCYSLESKLLMCQCYASRIMTGLQVNMDLAYQENIMPWELETFAAFSVLYDKDATDKLDRETFFHIIEGIRNYWHAGLTAAEEEGTYSEVFIMISSLQQFPVQGVALQKLFRYSYFFNFVNEKIDMKSEFESKFGAEYAHFEEFAYLTALCCSRNSSEVLGRERKQQLLEKLFGNRAVLDLLCVSQEEYLENFNKLYNRNETDLYYGLKIHYWYPFVSGKDGIYLPSPYLVINAVTDSFINRLTFGNSKLRRLFGKEVIESYLYDICSELPSTTWKSREIAYKIGHKNCLTSDVIISEGEYCVFYDTKASTPSLKLRKFDHEEIENDTLEYAQNIIQIYNQINAYENGYFQLDKPYSKDNLFGVVVVLEDSAIFRGKIYSKVFDLLEESGFLDSSTKDYIHSHIKVVSLQQIEIMVLQNSSFLPCLINQVNHPEQWDYYTYSTPTVDNGLIPLYESYGNDIKRRVIDASQN